MMFDAFRLIPAMQLIFKTEIEFTDECFADLKPAQRDAFERKEGEAKDRIYRVVPVEPTVIDRQTGTETEPGRVTLELSIVTESDRKNLLDAVAFVYRASAPINDKRPTFAERLAYLRPRLPPVVIGEDDPPTPGREG